MLKIVKLPGPEVYQFAYDANDLTIKDLPDETLDEETDETPDEAPDEETDRVPLSRLNGHVIKGIANEEGIVFPIIDAQDLERSDIQEILKSKTCVVRLTKNILIFSSLVTWFLISFS